MVQPKVLESASLCIIATLAGTAANLAAVELQVTEHAVDERLRFRPPPDRRLLPLQPQDAVHAVSGSHPEHPLVVKALW
jgi:hypothetical protein